MGDMADWIIENGRLDCEYCDADLEWEDHDLDCIANEGENDN